MSLSIGSSPSGYYGSGASGGAKIPAAGSSSDAQQTGAPQTVDQVDTTSITVTITQGSASLNHGQLRLGLDKIVPTGSGGSALQPYAEGYFSSPTNFVSTANGGGADSQAASEASITLQILNETTTDSTQSGQQPSDGSSSGAPTLHGVARTAPHQPVDISV
jgi:hypothetical protein